MLFLSLPLYIPILQFLSFTLPPHHQSTFSSSYLYQQMALEARHHNQSSSQIITNNREFVKIEEGRLNNSVPMGPVNPFATTMENPWSGLNHQFLGMNNMMIQPQTNSVKVETGPSNNLQNDPRKRSSESMQNQFNNLNIPPVTNTNVPIQGLAPQSNFPYDVQHFWDVDYILSQFNKNVNLELETQQQRNAKFMLATVTSKFVKRVKTQSEQISRMGKQNKALQERMKSLCEETQHWKTIAKTAEITSMSLRKDFGKILGKVSKLNTPTKAVVVEEDAESCYGSTDSGTNNEEVGQGSTRNSDRNKMCKICGERESSVLLLPCRHLCVCSVCGSSIQFCPVCNFCMTATVHVCLT